MSVAFRFVSPDYTGRGQPPAPSRPHRAGYPSSSNAHTDLRASSDAPRGLAAKGLDDRARSLDADGGHENREIGPRGAKRGELFPAAGHRTRQADRVQQAVAQRAAAGALLHLSRLLREAARPEEPLEKREGRVQAEILPGDIAHGVHVVANEDRQTHGDVGLAEPRGFGATAVDPGLALRHAGSRPQKRHDS